MCPIYIGYRTEIQQFEGNPEKNQRQKTNGIRQRKMIKFKVYIQKFQILR